MDAAVYYQNLLKRVLETIPDSGRYLVCGPMFVGLPVNQNMARIEHVQKVLTSLGKPVFNQIPYVDINLPDAPFEYALKFAEYYKPLIQSGKILGIVLVPGWEISEGTKSEAEYAREKGLPVFEATEDDQGHFHISDLEN